MKKINVLGTLIDNISILEAVERASALMDSRSAAYVVTPNAEIVLSARRNRRLSQALREAELSLPDGSGVLAAAAILGTPIGEKVSGVDFATALMARMSEQGRSVFLLGAEEGVAELAADRLDERYPGLVIAGINDGFFEDYDEELLIHRINEASPDLLIVCLGSPKQEIWMHEHKEVLQVGVMAGLGGAMNIFAGVSKRAPRKWQNLGLEWLYRLMKEPWRLRRTLRLPQIILAAIWRRIGGR